MPSALLTVRAQVFLWRMYRLVWDGAWPYMPGKWGKSMQWQMQFDTSSSFERVVKTIVSYLRSPNPHSAHFPCFSRVILTWVLQEVAFFGIINSEHCTHKTHLRELWRYLRYMGMRVPARTRCWLVWRRYLIGRCKRQQMQYSLIPCLFHLDL